MSRLFDDDRFITTVRAYARWKLDHADVHDHVSEEYLDASEFLIGLDRLIEGTSENVCADALQARMDRSTE
jgi:hypothetical protein